MSRTMKRTLKEMSFGIIIYELLLAFLCFILAEPMNYNRSSALLGVLIGSLILIPQLIDMAVIIEDSIGSMDEGYANKKTFLHAMIRRTALIFIAFICWYTGKVNILTLVLAQFGLKPGAYLQPIAARLRSGDGKEEKYGNNGNRENAGINEES